LFAAFLHFDLSFMLWVLPGALGIYISEGLRLSPFEKGLVVAVPILSGALLRLPMGLLSDRTGGKHLGTAMLLFLFLPLALAWQLGHSFEAWLLTGALLGVAGASFAVALPLASRWYPAERQGLVMGVAAAGNSGTVIANLAAPRLAGVFGWNNVLGLAMLPLALVLAVFALAAKDSPRRGPAESQAMPVGGLMRQADLWWFCLLYCVTFGGYVGLSSFLPLFLRDQYGFSAVTAGSLTAMIVFAGSASRPIGGHLADRFGGARLLSVLLVVAALAYSGIATLPAATAMVASALLLVVSLGMGNGAVFQVVPRRFEREIGVVTGIVGAFGGLGGFLLPTVLGAVKGLTGSFGPGFLALSVGAFFAAVMLRRLRALSLDWRRSWKAPGPPLPRRRDERVLMAPYLA